MKKRTSIMGMIKNQFKTWCLIYWYSFKRSIRKIGCFIRLGSILEHTIGLITLGWGKHVASWVARKLGYSNCYCDRRRVTMNQWTCPDYSETISII